MRLYVPEGQDDDRLAPRWVGLVEAIRRHRPQLPTAERWATGAGSASEGDPGRDRPTWGGHGPVVVIGAVIVGYVAVFGVLTWRQHANFGTFGFDLGIYDQALWLLSRFRDPFMTVRGLDYFGHHVNVLTLLFVPAYWLGAGPQFLLLTQTVWLAAGAIPVWLLARDRLASRWAATGLSAAFLLYPSLQWINWWHFHPDALIITPLLFAYWLATRGRWGWFWVAVLAALLAKEDAALAVVMLGILLAFREHRTHGAAVATAGVVWFVVATQVIIPWASGGAAPLYSQLYPGFGDSVPEIAFNVVRQPGDVLATATLPDRMAYYGHLLAPVAFLPLLALPALSIGAPQLLANVLSAHGYTHDIRFHYSAVIVAAVFLATVEGVALLRRRWSRPGLLAGVVVASALVANVVWSPSPISSNFDTGIWAGPAGHHPAVHAALARVPDDAGVSATYYLVPHLTHRTHVYEWPNPFVASNWGVRGSPPPDPDTVDVLVLDSRLLGDHAGLYAELVGPGGEFVEILERDGIVVARRTGDG